MAGIVGIQANHKSQTAHGMLEKIMYRGKKHNMILLKDGLTIGYSSNDLSPICDNVKKINIFSLSNREDSTSIGLMDKRISMKRDKYGVEPLYYVILNDNTLAFASEIKSLIGFNSVINELEPGYIFEDLQLRKYYELEKEEPLKIDQVELSVLLKDTLLASINKRLCGNKIGAWLSGGLDSSVISALAKPLVKEFHTFSVGFPNAPDLYYANIVANYIGSKHHERLITFKDLMRVLPDVIYHLESFDALLVRSSIMNYLVAQLASEYVDEVFSGEGGDELFAGYQYLKEMPCDQLEDELIDITKRLHNTALQRVDRCSNAFGTTAYVPFVDEEVVELAVRIPVDYKLYNGTEKWILRLAMKDDLPTEILMRTKSKFWEGSGMGEHFYRYAEGLIPNSDFDKEKNIKCGWELNSKEELMYYRIFKEHFGDLANLNWMGRSKLVTSNGELDEK
jgi:asparagine synthase (glutamine-hydrolysing)